jgi:ParB family chromosome partitioning protein
MTEVVSNVSSLCGVVDDIQISRIRHPRSQLRAAAYNIQELAASIAEKGLLQPIIIRSIENDGDFNYEIVAGNRRYEACKSLGWRKITCHVEELNDKEAFEIALAENIQRSTLSAIEEAKAFKIYISDHGWGGSTQLASTIGKSVSYVTRRIALLELPEEVIASIHNSILSTSIGEELCSVKDNTKQSDLAKLIATRHLSVRKSREIIDNAEEEDTRIASGPLYMQASKDSVSELQKPIEKTILILRIAMNKLGVVIDSIDEDGWPVKELLLHEKNAIHRQVDTLLKGRKKYDYDLVRMLKKK